MLGARRSWIRLVFLILVVVVSRAAVAEEFGNLLVPGVEDLSRQASAQALGAASMVLKGLQSRELRQADSEKEAFVGAARDLRSAANKMDTILKQTDSDAELKKIMSSQFVLERDI